MDFVNGLGRCRGWTCYQAIIDDQLPLPLYSLQPPHTNWLPSINCWPNLPLLTNIPPLWMFEHSDHWCPIMPQFDALPHIISPIENWNIYLGMLTLGLVIRFSFSLRRDVWWGGGTCGEGLRELGVAKGEEKSQGSQTILKNGHCLGSLSLIIVTADTSSPRRCLTRTKIPTSPTLSVATAKLTPYPQDESPKPTYITSIYHGYSSPNPTAFMALHSTKTRNCPSWLPNLDGWSRILLLPPSKMHYTCHKCSHSQHLISWYSRWGNHLAYRARPTPHFLLQFFHSSQFLWFQLLQYQPHWCLFALREHCNRKI